MRNETLSKTYSAAAAIKPYRIVRWGNKDGEVQHANGATSDSIGVSDRIAAPKVGNRVEVVRAGIAEVEYGGTVTRGALLAADSTGRAVATTATNARVIGIAEVSGVVGDVGSLLIAPSRI